MALNLAEFINAQYGVNIYPNVNPGVNQVGTTAVQICPNNPNRFGLNIVNLSANSLYVWINNTVSSSLGILLNPNGGTLNLNWQDDLNLCGWEWWGVATGASSNISVIEYVGY